MVAIKKPGSSSSTIDVKYGKDKRISDTISAKLNSQIAVELNASQLYRAMASWCEYKGYFSTANFLNKHADEELNHLKKIQKYLLDRNCISVMPATSKQPSMFENLLDVIKKSYEHEKFVSSTYEELADYVLTSKDHTTYGFIQWFLKEQVEEESVFSGLVDKIEMMVKEGVGILQIDKQIGQSNDCTSEL